MAVVLMRIDSLYFEGEATTTQRGIWDLYRSGSWREDGRRGHPTEKVKLLRLIGSHVGTGRQQQSLRSGELGHLLPRHHLASMPLMITAFQWHTWVSTNEGHSWVGGALGKWSSGCHIEGY